MPLAYPPPPLARFVCVRRLLGFVVCGDHGPDTMCRRKTRTTAAFATVFVCVCVCVCVCVRVCACVCVLARGADGGAALRTAAARINIAEMRMTRTPRTCSSGSRQKEAFFPGHPSVCVCAFFCYFSPSRTYAPPRTAPSLAPSHQLALSLSFDRSRWCAKGLLPVLAACLSAACPALLALADPREPKSTAASIRLTRLPSNNAVQFVVLNALPNRECRIGLLLGGFAKVFHNTKLVRR